jgi:hypothetical protein
LSYQLTYTLAMEDMEEMAAILLVAGEMAAAGEIVKAVPEEMVAKVAMGELAVEMEEMAAMEDKNEKKVLL